MKQKSKEKLKLLYRYIPGKKLLALCIRAFVLPRSIDKILRFWGWFSFDVSEKNGGTKSIYMFNYCSDIESQIFWYGIEGGWEKSEIAVWNKHVKEAQTILDIGANTGVYALLAKTINPNAEVYAFEPVERIFSKLEKNTEKNNLDIHLEKIAISNATGEAVIYDPMYENVTSVAVNTNLATDGEEYVKVPIKTVTLDDFCEAHAIGKVDLIKIDVESHEPEVLAGYTKLQEHMPVILCEIWNNEIGQRVQQIILEDRYNYYLIDETKENPVEMKSITVPSELRYCNYLFVPKSRISQ